MEDRRDSKKALLDEFEVRQICLGKLTIKKTALEAEAAQQRETKASNR